MLRFATFNRVCWISTKLCTFANEMRIPLCEIYKSLGLQNDQDSPSFARKIRPLLGGGSGVDGTELTWALHPQGSMLGVGHGLQLCVIHTKSANSESFSKPPSLPVVNCPLPAKLTSLAWLCQAIHHNNNNIDGKSKMDANQSDPLASHLMAGTEKGEFLVYDMLGEVVVRQRLHTGQVVGICPRPSCMGMLGEQVEEISVIFPDVVVCISLPELLAFVRLHEAGSGQGFDPSLKMAHGKYDVSHKCGARTGGINIGEQRPTLKATLSRSEAGKDRVKISIITGGKSPAVGAYEASVVPGSGGALAMFGRLASSMTLGMTGIAWNVGKKAWKSGVSSFFSSGSDIKDENLVQAESGKLKYALRDSKRQISEMLVAPNGLLAVAVDNLGRVTLFDTGKMIVIRMWKGYREAQCGWITRKSAQNTNPRLDLFLVIYAPRREILEVWPMRHGPRISSIQIPCQALILRTTPPMGLLENDWQTDCWLIELESGEVWNVGDRVFN